MTPSISRPRWSSCAVSEPAIAGDQPDQAVALAEVDRQHLVAERLLRRREHPVVVGARVVELGDHDDARHVHVGALAPQRPGRLVDALVGGDHEHRAVGGAQPGAQLAHEVGVPGGVEEVDLDAVVHQRREGQADRPLLAQLGLVEVADRGALGRRTRPG